VNVRHVADADYLAAGALGVPNIPGSYRFDFVVPSPDGTQFAVGIAPLSDIGTPRPNDERRATAIIFMRFDGRITGVAPIPPGDMRGPSDWSPDGSRFAMVVSGEREGDGFLLVFSTTGSPLATYLIERAYLGNFPWIAWSPNSQRLAYTGVRGLSIATFDAAGRNQLIPGADEPAWRP
jgi:hypothetical protein